MEIDMTDDYAFVQMRLRRLREIDLYQYKLRYYKRLYRDCARFGMTEGGLFDYYPCRPEKMQLYVDEGLAVAGRNPHLTKAGRKELIHLEQVVNRMKKAKAIGAYFSDMTWKEGNDYDHN